MLIISKQRAWINVEGTIKSCLSVGDDGAYKHWQRKGESWQQEGKEEVSAAPGERPRHERHRGISKISQATKAGAPAS